LSAPIFISYSSKDREIAETICRALEARGQNCWIACRNVRAGENFQEAIVRALRGARVMLLVFSSNANNSDEIKKELVLAGRHHVTVVPARVDDVVPSDAFTYELATRQWIDLFKNWEQAIEQLSSQLDDILRTAKPEESKADVAPWSPRRAVGPKPSNKPALIAALVLFLLLIAGGTVFFLKPWASPAPAVTQAAPQALQLLASQAPTPQASSSHDQTIAQKPQLAPAVGAPVRTATAKEAPHEETRIAPPQPAATAQPAPPVASVPAPAPEPAAAAPRDPDETAWQAANSDGTRLGFGQYLKSFAAGNHAQEAQLRIADLILKSSATGTNFDGSWQTIWTCPNVGQYPGYSYRFIGEVHDGNYHGARGAKGEPSSIVLDGKVEADGAAAFFGEVIVGSSLAGLGAARGTPSDFHALAQLDHGSGSGRRLEGRGCSLSFEKG
jgi:hypothetical protein